MKALKRSIAVDSVIDRFDAAMAALDHDHARDFTHDDLPARTTAMHLMIPPAHVVGPWSRPRTHRPATIRQPRTADVRGRGSLFTASRHTHCFAVRIDDLGRKRRIEHACRMRRRKRTGPRGVERQQSVRAALPKEPTALARAGVRPPCTTAVVTAS